MKQRGQQSAAALVTVTSMPMRLLPAPLDLTEEESAIWCRVVATKPGDWWDAGNMPLLASMCRAVVQSELVGEQVRLVSAHLADDDGLARYKLLRKLQAELSGEINTLARAMRLTQQSKYNTKSADTADRKASGRKPWLEILEG